MFLLVQIKTETGTTATKRGSELAYLLIEKLLQALVGEVDAELLETVLLEAFKTEDIEDADPVQLGLSDFRTIQSSIHLAHKPVKDAVE